MKTTQTLLATLALSAGLFAATAANASLTVSDGGKTVFDDDLNIYWLADANYAKTSGYDADGQMDWYQAQDWIASLNTANYLGYSDWRLPASIDTGAPGCDWGYNGSDCGYNSTGSELAHLYYNELGNIGYINTAGGFSPGISGLVNEGPFTNLQVDRYWSSQAAYPSDAWSFHTDLGYQSSGGKTTNMLSMAVRPGQVAAVPVPAAAWLLCSGLLGLVGVARRKAA